MAKFEIMVRDIDAKGGFTSPLSPKENIMWKTINADDGRAHDAIYVYSGPRDFYVGQTVNFLKRHGQHYKDDQPFVEGRYDRVAIVFGQAVNGNLNALESLLIIDMEKDNQHNHKPTPRRRWNKTEGNKSQNKMQIASDVEPLIWKGLHEKGFVSDPDLAAVKQQDLMVGPGDTYPTEYERKIVESVLAKADENHVVQGYAGTGKTFVICMLADRLSRAPYNKKVAVAVKDNVAKLYKSKFRTWGTPVTVAPYSGISCGDEHYDTIIVDESHRLRRKYSKTKFLHRQLWQQCDKLGVDNELELIKAKAGNVILMYDALQTLRPDDITPKDFQKATEGWNREHLTHQVRINPISSENYTVDLGDGYVAGLIDFLQYPAEVAEGTSYDKSIFTNYGNTDDSSSTYFGVCDSIQELFDYIDFMGNLHPGTINRVVAGYTRKWESRGDPEAYDWIEGDHRWKWNSTFEGWVNPVRADVEKARALADQYHDEIGCVHSVQGEDLNYVGVVVGKDLGIDGDGDLVGVRSNYCDRNGTPSRDDFDQDTFTRFIKNNYFTLMTRAIDGIRVYFEDPAMRRRFEEFMRS